ncbi:HopJ type III effector protein [Gilvimarinus algae]|uniref:HopJ type III effector protein n=1 Tax=Gilvimarinus algae TaxID=3058037 RepID=A0ABT8TAV2_9GAMM|nr:HopJ type III effector protein [Gilvimarinus sp. SDUM040014]MDO3381242.1 HopJ type III effector protein [Gilvimarinus sp. SDUM040014]
MTLEMFLTKLTTEPLNVEFDETMAIIEAYYRHTPTAFTNGELHNGEKDNQGSCKILAFGQLNGLTEAQTLACFGRYYREDVLQHPEGSDHGNIRNFIAHGWAGVAFKGEALEKR